MKTRPARPLGRPLTAAGMAAVAIISTGALVWTPSTASTDRGQTPAKLPLPDGRPPHSPSERRIREGTEIVEKLGYFRVTGDRVTFLTDDGKQRLIALENLNLERIARAVADDPDKLQWSVTGTVTEYRGSNFLFVRRAVLKAKPASEQPPY